MADIASTGISRSGLYDLVWSQPIKSLATTISVPEVSIRKACARGHIPLPNRGHWAKIAAGKKCAMKVLPPRPPGVHERIIFGTDRSIFGHVDQARELAAPPPAPPEFSEPFDALRQRLDKEVGRPKPVRDLEAPTSSVARLLAEDDKRRARQAQRSFLSSWDAPLFDAPFERRRLRIIDSIARALAAHNGSFKAYGKQGRHLIATVGQTTMVCELDHPDAKPDHWGNPTTREGPMGPLKLVIRPGGQARHFQSVWRDDEAGKLETKLRQILVDLLVAGEECYRGGEQHRYDWSVERRKRLQAEQQRLDEEARHRDEARARAESRARRHLLFTQARDWRRAQDIRAFVKEVLDDPVRAEDDNLHRWSAWALAEADALDPLRSGSLSF